MDINFTNTKDNGFEVRLDDIPTSCIGNQVMANIFEITFLTNLNDSLMSYGHGGDGVKTIGREYDPNKLQDIAAAVKVSSDNTVAVMKIDQNSDNTIPATEKIVSASVVSVTKDLDQVAVVINLIPEQFDNPSAPQPLFLTLPI